MLLVSQEDTTHNIVVVPRFLNIGTNFTMDIRREGFKELTPVTDIVAVIENGELEIIFNATFKKKNRYDIHIYNNSQTLYKGRILATTQLAQNYIENYLTNE